MGAGRSVGWTRRTRELVKRRARTLRASELLDLVLPRECGGCLRPGDEWCARCSRALAALAFVEPAAGAGPPRVRTRPAADERLRAHGGRPAEVGPLAPDDERPGRGGGAPWVVPHRAPAGMPPVHAWGIYADPLRAVVSAWKDGGRRDLVRVLVPLLAASIVGALDGLGWDDGEVLVVPAPSSRHAERQRGDTPMVGLCQAAAGIVGRARPTGVPCAERAGPALVIRVAPALVHVRRVEDQSGLGTAARRGNLKGALTVKPLWHNVVRGRRCLLVDDVVTTGATLAEAARALRAVGAGPVVGATIAATQRTRG